MKHELKKILERIWPFNYILNFLWRLKIIYNLPNQAYNYDIVVADLQLAYSELVSPGNRARLDALKDSHKGERCFIIGNGPSLKASDLDKLKANGEFCFGSNRIYLIFDKTEWRPDIWCTVDRNGLSYYYEEYCQLTGFTKITPCVTLTRLNKPLDNTIYFPVITGSRFPPPLVVDIRNGASEYLSVTMHLINLAVYMGFEELYLIGVDHNLRFIKDTNGILRLVAADSHFSSDYIDIEMINRVHASKKQFIAATKSYKDLRYQCEAIGVKIYNATRGGELEVYERVKLEDVLPPPPPIDFTY